VDVPFDHTFLIFGAYALVGCALTVFGPLHRAISRAAQDVAGVATTTAIVDRAPTSKLKLLAFRLLLNVGSIALWPVFFVSAVREERKSKDATERYVKEGLYFDRMGGAGTIGCRECGFSTSIVSSLHWWGGPNSAGYQCKSCGIFVTLEGVGNEARIDGGCGACGGPVARDEQLVCPRCGSDQLHYDIEYIT